MNENLKPRERFTDRVAEYRRFRPSYPAAAVEWLSSRVGTGAAVADVGSGTGIFSAQLLSAGFRVFAVEANESMRHVAEQELGGDARFTSINASAEATGLVDASVALVTAAQAFHWFEPSAARREFERILQPGGRVALIWNDRDEESPFGIRYEALIRRHATDSKAVEMREAAMRKQEGFWPDGKVEVLEFRHHQLFDREGLHGRTSSSSYAPKPGTPAGDALYRELDALFADFARAGTIEFRYVCRMFTGTFR